MNILIFIVILLILVLSHEFGHFIVAKKMGMRVDEFSFGFPPKLFGKKIGDTSYNFNLLPLGGYVKIYGENSSDEALKKDGEIKNDPDYNRSFMNKSWYKRLAVLFAGVSMNFIVAWLLLSIGFISGLPSSAEVAPKGTHVRNEVLTVISVVSNSPAQKVGIKTGDKILSLREGDNTLTSAGGFLKPEAVQSFVKDHPSQSINFSLLRGKKNLEVNVTPEKLSGGKIPEVGISMDIIGTLKLPVYTALWQGFKLSGDLLAKTAVGFYSLVANSLVGHGNLSDVAGPIGIIKIVGDAASFGFIYLLSFTALISINLVIINLFPFPALDGGQILFLIIEKIKGSRIKPKVANTLNLAGFSLLIIFMLVVTYHDILKLL